MASRSIAVRPAIVVRSEEPPAASNAVIPAELSPPGPVEQAAEFQRTIEWLVEQKVAEITCGADAIFQPFLQSKRIATAIKRLQTVDEQQKYAHYFVYGAALFVRDEMLTTGRWGCA